MILNCSTTDPNKILPITYPWAREYYRAGVANNWVPEEISMQKDVEQWKSKNTLNDEERRLILWNLGFFSTAESLTANNIVLSVYKHITNPEARQYMLRQAFEEAIHTDTFIYCCDTLSLDPDEIYNMYQTIPSISGKDDFVVGLTKSILDPNFSTDTTEGVRDFLRDIVGFYVIMEGIFFYAGFAMMLALKRQGKMVGMGEQFEFILRDECLDYETELLTPNGWVPVTDIDYDTKIIQWHEDGTLTFTKPKKLSKSKVEEVYTFSSHQNHVNQCVSENHRIAYITKHGNLKVIPAKDATPNVYNKFINTGVLKGTGRLKLSPRERFLVALQADGTIPDPELRNGSICGYRTYGFMFSKKRKINRLLEIIDELGWDKKISHKDGKTSIKVKVPLTVPTNKKFSEWLSLEGITESWCRDFIQEISLWDGHKVDGKELRITYGCVDESNVDLVQAIASLAGYRTCKSIRPDDRKETYNDYYRLHICRHMNTTTGGAVIKQKKQYDDFVYGIEVPSSYLLIRRKGAVSVTGNSIHLAFGNDVISTVKHEFPKAWTTDLQEEIISLIKTAVDLEKKYAHDACPKGVLGINAKQFCDYVEYIADRRLVRLGLSKVYEKENPFPWMSMAADLSKEKNFFETRVTEYQGGSLVWD